MQQNKYLKSLHAFYGPIWFRINLRTFRALFCTIKMSVLKLNLKFWITILFKINLFWVTILFKIKYNSMHIYIKKYEGVPGFTFFNTVAQYPHLAVNSRHKLTIFIQLFSSNVLERSVAISMPSISTQRDRRTGCCLINSSLQTITAAAPSLVGLCKEKNLRKSCETLRIMIY